MSIKINHYAAKTVTLLYQQNFEAFVIELSIAIILTVMAVGGYSSGLWLLWIPCALIAAVCYFAVIYSVYLYISEKIVSKSVNDNNSQ
jgi:hypothetical protein